MSRNIPRVRTWIVTFYRDGQLRDRVFVQAPTKVLARLNVWFERPDICLANWDADRVTYAVKRRWPNMCGRRR